MRQFRSRSSSVLRHRLAAFVLIELLVALPSVQAAGSSSFRVIVHPAIERQSIERSLLSKMFLGQAKLWESGLKVLPVNQLKDSDIRADFSHEIHRQKVAALEAYWLRQIFSGRATPPPTLKSEKEVVSYVTSRPGAIGYVSVDTRLEGVAVLQVETEAGFDRPGSGAPGEERDKREIEALLKRYARALENKDIEALTRVWPSLTSVESKAILESFRLVRTLRVGLFIQDFQISGPGATVTCKRRDEMVPVRGKPVVGDVLATFVLDRTDQGWVISAIRD